MEGKCIMHLFSTPIGSPVLIILSVVYLLLDAVCIFDTRVTQSIRNNVLPLNQKRLSNVISLFVLLMWLCMAVIFLLNWWYAIILFVIQFILKVLPVLETIGATLLRPFFGAERTTLTLRKMRAFAGEQSDASKRLSDMSRNVRK